MDKFERKLITSIYKGDTSIEIFGECEYELQVNKYDKKGCSGICEIVGLEEFQVKPYFDIDSKIGTDHVVELFNIVNPDTFNDETRVVTLFNVVFPDETKVVLFTNFDIPLTFNIPK